MNRTMHMVVVVMVMMSHMMVVMMMMHSVPIGVKTIRILRGVPDRRGVSELIVRRRVMHGRWLVHHVAGVHMRWVHRRPGRHDHSLVGGGLRHVHRGGITTLRRWREHWITTLQGWRGHEIIHRFQRTGRERRLLIRRSNQYRRALNHQWSILTLPL